MLRLNGNQIVNIAPVAGCFRLNHLFLANNQIADLAPLTGLVYLANLDLAGNAIVDLAPLVANTGFGNGDQIWVAGNPAVGDRPQRADPGAARAGRDRLRPVSLRVEDLKSLPL